MIQQHWKVESSFADERLLIQNEHVTDWLEYQKPEKDWAFTLVILTKAISFYKEGEGEGEGRAAT